MFHRSLSFPMSYFPTSPSYEPSHMPPPDSQPIQIALLLTSGVYILYPAFHQIYLFLTQAEQQHYHGQTTSSSSPIPLALRISSCPTSPTPSLVVEAESRSLKDSGSPLLPPRSWYTTPCHPLPPPTATFVLISVTMAQNALSTPVLPVVKWPQVMLLIIVWQPNVISVINGDILMISAIFGSVEGVMNEDMWWITVQSTPYPNLKLNTLMLGPTWRMMTSIPLWMMTERLRYVEPRAWMYKGGNVMILFLHHVFFLVLVVHHPYFHFAPHHEETDHYLLAFPSSSSSLFLPL